MKSKIENKLDKIFSLCVRARADYTCEYCGNHANPRGLHTSHYIGRRYRMTRWELDNAACLCLACHNIMHDFAATHREFFTKRLGSDRLEQMELSARIGSKPDKEKILEHLTELLKGVE